MENYLEKYPLTAKFMRLTGLSLDETLRFTEEKIREIEGEGKNGAKY